MFLLWVEFGVEGLLAMAGHLARKLRRANARRQSAIFRIFALFKLYWVYTLI
jgi:hypothetical protein